jgi:hypothetical protein
MYTVDDTTLYIEEKTTDGQTHKFYLLSPYDRFEMIAELKRARRQRMIDNLVAAEIDKESRFGELEAFEDEFNGEAEFIKFVNSPEADIAIPERALRLPDAAAAKAIVSKLKLPRANLLPFKAALTGLDIVNVNDQPSSDVPLPDALNPSATYGSEAPSPNVQTPLVTYGT